MLFSVLTSKLNHEILYFKLLRLVGNIEGMNSKYEKILRDMQTKVVEK